MSPTVKEQVTLFGVNSQSGMIYLGNTDLCVIYGFAEN